MQNIKSSVPSYYPDPDTSISSPSGTGRSDPLCDWAHAVAHEGGVKTERMLHINTKLKFITSCSGHITLAAGGD